MFRWGHRLQIRNLFVVFMLLYRLRDLLRKLSPKVVSESCLHIELDISDDYFAIVPSRDTGKPEVQPVSEP